MITLRLNYVSELANVGTNAEFQFRLQRLLFGMFPEAHSNGINGEELNVHDIEIETRGIFPSSGKYLAGLNFIVGVTGLQNAAVKAPLLETNIQALLGELFLKNEQTQSWVVTQLFALSPETIYRRKEIKWGGLKMKT